MRDKFSEIVNIYREFCDVASYFGAIIVRERALPVEQKSIKPISSKKSDRGAMIHKYQVRNIRFRFACDEHGLFNGSDEMVSTSTHDHSLFLQISLTFIHAHGCFDDDCHNYHRPRRELELNS